MSSDLERLLAGTMKREVLEEAGGH